MAERGHRNMEGAWVTPPIAPHTALIITSLASLPVGIVTYLGATLAGYPERTYTAEGGDNPSFFFDGSIETATDIALIASAATILVPVLVYSLFIFPGRLAEYNGSISRAGEREEELRHIADRDENEVAERNERRRRSIYG